MKYFVIFITTSAVCFFCYNAGIRAGASASKLDTVSCVVAVRTAMEDMCKHPEQCQELK